MGSSAKRSSAKAPRPESIGHERIAAITGPIDPARIARIVAVQPTQAELEEAVAWASGASDVMGKLRRPLTGTVAELYDILTADKALDEEEG